MKSIAVCCLTRNRPLMLEAALSSVLKLETPEGCELLFICVENDSEFLKRGSQRNYSVVLCIAGAVNNEREADPKKVGSHYL